MSTSVEAGSLPLAQSQAQASCEFEALYHEHFDFVWRSLRRFGVDASLIEDATQDTFVVVHRRLADLRQNASRKAFLFGIAMRVAQDYRRRARRKGAETLDLESSVSREAGPFEHTAKVEAARLVERFLETLDDDKRAVFSLSDLEELSAPEISEALGVKLNTVYSRLRVARDLFIAYLAAGKGHG
jgi:RNA polymerase sigma-70 factor (ECF subfamily)